MDKSIEAAAVAYEEAFGNCGGRDGHVSGLRAAIAAYRDAEIERLTAEIEQLRDSLKHKWQEGQPPKWFDEWFIARTSFGDRCVLKRLPEEYTYQYTTADGTYFMAEKLVAWMQFPDSNYKPLLSDEADLRAKLAEAERDARAWHNTWAAEPCDLKDLGGCGPVHLCQPCESRRKIKFDEAARGGERG